MLRIGGDLAPTYPDLPLVTRAFLLAGVIDSWSNRCRSRSAMGPSPTWKCG